MPAARLRTLLLRSAGNANDAQGVRIEEAHITGRLDLSDVSTSLPIRLEACLFDEPVLLRNSQVGLLSLSNSHLPALHADFLHVGQSLNLSHTVITHTGNTVTLESARIGGELNLAGAKLTSDATALWADGLQVDGRVAMTGLAAAGRGDAGTVRLLGGRINGQLQLAGAELRNSFGSAFIADGLEIFGDAVLEGLTAVGHGADGAVRLRGTHVTGQLNLSRAHLANYAKHSENPSIDYDYILPRHYGKIGPRGALELPRGQISGVLDLTGETGAAVGPALLGDGMQIDGGAFITDIEAIDHGEMGTVRLMGAHISGALVINGQVTSRSSRNVVLDLRHSTVDGPVYLWDEQHWKERLSLAGGERPRLRLDGFAYRTLPTNPGLNTWIKVLQRCTTAYGAQPYRHLSEVCREAGYAEQATTVRMAQYEAFRAALRTKEGPLQGVKWWRRTAIRARWLIFKWVIGYGYRASRALFFLFLVISISCLAFAYATAHEWLVHSRARGGKPCGMIEALGSAIDQTVPFLSFAGAGRCELSNAHGVQWIFLATLLLKILSWIFLTLFVAGFTGIVHEPDT